MTIPMRKLIVLLVPAVFLQMATASEKYFGETCDKVNRCDSRSFLSCLEGTCKCVIPEDMTYDPVRKRCLALASEKCKYATSEDQKQFNYADCVPNASCNSEGICVCNNHHVEKPNGTCVEQSGFNEPCQSTSECRSNLHLTCINGFCQCDPETAVDNWNVGFGSTRVRIVRDQHKCVGLADKPCLGGECTINAVCTGLYKDRGPGTCDCKRGMVKSEGGLCGTVDFDYDASCNAKEKRYCHANFTCFQGKCRCKYSEIHQFYDTAKEICRSYAWGPCEIDGVANQCVENGACVINNRTGLAQCECERGFVENLEGKCELAFGADCIPNDASLKCDQMAPLYCRDGKCGCEDALQMYDPISRRCRGLVGAVCNENLPCVPYATCVQRYEPFVDLGSQKSGKRGQCHCIPLERQTADRTCSPPEAAA